MSANRRDLPEFIAATLPSPLQWAGRSIWRRDLGLEMLSNGARWSPVGGLTEAQQSALVATVQDDGSAAQPTETRATTGLLSPATLANGADLVFQPTGTPAQTITFAYRAILRDRAAAANSGAGHVGGGLLYYRKESGADPNAAYAGESKFEHASAGTTVTLGVGHETQLALCDGPMTIWNGVNSNAFNINAAIALAVMHNAGMHTFGASGSVGTYYGYYQQDMSALAAKAPIRYAFKNDDPGAQIHSKAPIVDSAVRREAPSSGATITLTKDHSTLILSHGATIAALTINLPAPSTLEDMHPISLVSLSAVTTLTVNGNGANAALWPTSLSAGVPFRMKLDKTGNLWWQF